MEVAAQVTAALAAAHSDAVVVTSVEQALEAAEQAFGVGAELALDMDHGPRPTEDLLEELFREKQPRVVVRYDCGPEPQQMQCEFFADRRKRDYPHTARDLRRQERGRRGRR